MTTPSATQLQCDSAIQAPTRRLAGWLSAGMLDWPGRVAATLFLSGCQMRCPYCHNPSLIDARSEASDAVWRDVQTYLERRRAWVDGFVVTGGEPTTDPDLIQLLEYFVAADVPVKLDTNGLKPDVLETILQHKLVSYVALDVKASPQGYARLSSVPDAADRVAESVALVLSSGVAHEFRTTCHPEIVHAEDLISIARTLRGGALYALQQFRPGITLDPDVRDHVPYGPTRLLEIAEECSAYLPTITRGV